MERRPDRHIPGKPVRQAHPRHRFSPGLTALAMAWTGLLAAVSMGTAFGGAGMPGPALAPLRPVVVAGAPSERPASVPPAIGTSRQSDGAFFDVTSQEPVTLACSARSEAPPAMPEPSTPSTPPSAARATTQPVAAFLGDSYTTGYNGFGLGAVGWPALVSAALDLEPLNRAVAGTGFVNPGWTGQPIRTRLDPVIKANPRVVFLAGGHNDRRYGAAAALDAARPVIQRLHAALPDSILVIVGPIWQNGSVPSGLRSLDDGLRQLAASVGAVFIDPVRGGWFAGTWQQLISGDGIHPTNAGHRRIADLVLASLAASPAVTPAPSAQAPAAASAGAPAPEVRAPATARSAAAPCPA